jgi:hypothetical protein
MGKKDFHPLLCALFAWVAVLKIGNGEWEEDFHSLFVREAHGV